MLLFITILLVFVTILFDISLFRTGKRSIPKGPKLPFPQKIFDALEKEPLLLIHGRAGTGKSTLIRELLADEKMRQVVVAPTGLAALQVGGQTIHAFFGIPVGSSDANTLGSVSDKQADLIKRVQRIIIDEISMVRADLLDKIDFRLREIQRDDRPFGGVKMVMVGDFYQLPPIVNKDKKENFEEIYEDGYIFSAKVLKQIQPKIVELDQVFRQTDKEFIEILANIRKGEKIKESLEFLNERCVSKEHKRNNRPVLLAFHNNTVKKYNKEELDKLSGKTFEYQAAMEGDLDAIKNDLPALETLHLKIGARVMMLKNDAMYRWVNGSLGTVTDCAENHIQVKLDGDSNSRIYQIDKYTWEMIVYKSGQKADEIKREVVGKYTQFPVNLAWARTVHKAQGMTLDDVRIDCSKKSFACGQVYVALSRASSLAGLSFTDLIEESDIRVDRGLEAKLKSLEQIV